VQPKTTKNVKEETKANKPVDELTRTLPSFKRPLSVDVMVDMYDGIKRYSI